MATDALKIKRGLKKDVPDLMAGEFGLALDTDELYIGGYTGNIKLVNDNELEVVKQDVFDELNELLSNQTIDLKDKVDILLILNS